MGEPVPLDSLSLFPSLLAAAPPWTAGIGARAAPLLSFMGGRRKKKGHFALSPLSSPLFR